MATVRMYKVAELLGMSSPEAISLLKQDTGIEVKSASSSIEEIVARQFVERHARKRQITLPSGPLFIETSAPARKPAGKGAKAPVEPPKPAAPTLRPRLIKTIKPAPAQASEASEEPPAPAEPEAAFTDAPSAHAAVEAPAAVTAESAEPPVEAPAGGDAANARAARGASRDAPRGRRRRRPPPRRRRDRPRARPGPCPRRADCGSKTL